MGGYNARVTVDSAQFKNNTVLLGEREDIVRVEEFCNVYCGYMHT
jgi:hypothetical protein